MSASERLVVWLLGFLAGLSLGIISNGGGGGGFWPSLDQPPLIPDYVPDNLVEKK